MTALQPLKIFADRRFVHAQTPHVEMLYPFWGKNPEDPRHPKSGQFDVYQDHGVPGLTFAPLADADVVVVPVAWQYALRDRHQRQLIVDCVEQATASNKPALMFYVSDFDQPIPLQNTIVYRTSLLASKRRPYEFSLPGWSEDFVTHYCAGQLPLRHKPQKPTVSFCGLSKPLDASPMQRVKEFLIQEERLTGIKLGNLGSVIRARALRSLVRSPLIETSMIIRSG
ncbi:MAG: hypothetical protein VKK04_26640, partial [Synechococcales bacterium]|nr:hypothetical protein [Synechococcales bacterium]